MGNYFRRDDGRKFLIDMRNAVANAQNQISNLVKREKDLFNSDNTLLVDIHREMEAAYLAVITGLARVDSADSILDGLGKQMILMFEPKWGQELKISQGFYTSVDVDVDNGASGSTLTYQGQTPRVGADLVSDVPHWDTTGSRALVAGSTDSGHNGEFSIDATITTGNVIGFTTTMGGIDSTQTLLVLTLLSVNLG